MSLWIQIAAVVVVALIVREALVGRRARAAFRIEIRRGEPVLVSGKLAGRFLNDVGDIARRGGLTAGTITGREGPHGVGLDFSRHFSAEARQQVRNAWGYSGGKGPSSRRRRP